MLRVERRKRIVVVHFDRADGRNALSLTALDAMRETFEALAQDGDPPNAVILTGTGAVFSVGFDLKDPSVQGIVSATIGERLKGPQKGAAACRALASLDAYTIVAVEGWCLGGGLAIALAADLIVAGQDARFGLPEVDRGMNLGWTALPRLIARVGPAGGKRLAILGEILPADVAATAGIVDEVVPDGTALDRALALAELAAAKPPLALRMIKRGANGYTESMISGSAALDAEQFALATLTEDFAEGMAAFRDKRPPEYNGR